MKKAILKLFDGAGSLFLTLLPATALAEDGTRTASAAPHNSDIKTIRKAKRPPLQRRAVPTAVVKIYLV